MNKKEPWEMTENEYLAFKEFMDSMEAARMKHKKDIEPVQGKLDRGLFVFHEEYADTKNAIVKKYEEFKRLLRKSTET